MFLEELSIACNFKLFNSIKFWFFSFDPSVHNLACPLFFSLSAIPIFARIFSRAINPQKAMKYFCSKTLLCVNFSAKNRISSLVNPRLNFGKLVGFIFRISFAAVEFSISSALLSANSFSIP